MMMKCTHLQDATSSLKHQLFATGLLICTPVVPSLLEATPISMVHFTCKFLWQWMLSAVTCATKERTQVLYTSVHLPTCILFQKKLTMPRWPTTRSFQRSHFVCS